MNWDRYGLMPDCSCGLDIICRDCDHDQLVATWGSCCRYEPKRKPVTMAAAIAACEAHEAAHHAAADGGEQT